jgi:hypothetical protein
MTRPIFVATIVFCFLASAGIGCGDDTGDKECVDGETKCSGEQIMKCTADGVFGAAEDCPSGEMCKTMESGLQHCMAMEGTTENADGMADMDGADGMADMDGGDGMADMDGADGMADMDGADGMDDGDTSDDGGDSSDDG